MTRIDGLSLTEAEHAIEEAHPGWHVWHSTDGEKVGSEYATCTVGAGGATVSAPSVERIEEAIGKYEHERGMAA